MSAKEIREKFGEDLDNKLVEECVNICKLYNLPAEDLLFKWEAATYNFTGAFRTQTRREFDAEAVATLKATLQRELADKKKQVRPTRGTPFMSRNSRMPNFNRNVNIPTPGRSNPVKTEDVDMDVDFGVTTPTHAASTVVFKGPKTDPESRKSRAYRYMYEKMVDRSSVLNKQMEFFQDLVEDHYKIRFDGDPASTSDEEIYVIGRISQDIEQSTSTKLEQDTLLLETTWKLDSNRVPLRFPASLIVRGGAKGSGGLGVFPGALVALKGKNGGGGWFSVSELLVPPSLKIRPSKPDPEVLNATFSICICSGPYTPEAELDFTPWNSCLTVLEEKKPSVLVLIGPFIDATHNSILGGDIDYSPLDLVHKHFTDPIKSFLDSSPGSIAVLVPSVRDLVNAHAVFPQAEFGSDVSKRDPRIHLVPNPAHFTLNGIAFGVTSADVVFHMKTHELFIAGNEMDCSVPQYKEDVDGMANTCRHLLQQRSFYPIFPVPQEESHDINLDVTHAKGLTVAVDEAYAPDVLIVPSRLKHFVKSLDGTTVANPSSVMKGTFVMIDVLAGKRSMTDRIQAKAVKIDSL